jgi:hypothetical protein
MLPKIAKLLQAHLVIKLASGENDLRSPMPRCQTNAHSTASTTLPNSPTARRSSA